MKLFHRTEEIMHYFLSKKTDSFADTVEVPDDFVHEYERVYRMAQAFEHCVINQKFSMEAYLKALSKEVEAK